MTNFPASIYSPRAKKNRAGVTYDANKQDLMYVEDVQKLDDEVVAIENLLGVNGQSGAINGVIARKKLLESYFLSNSLKVIYNPLLTYAPFSTAVGGGGTIGQFFAIGYCRTSASANGWARQNYNSQELYISYLDAVNYTKAYVGLITGNKLAFIGISQGLLTTQTSLIATPYTTIHAGFIFENDKFYCSSGNGSNQQTTEITKPTSVAIFKISMNATAGIDFFINGVLVATHSTYYSNSYGYMQWFVSNLSVASDTYLYFYNHGYTGP